MLRSLVQRVSHDVGTFQELWEEVQVVRQMRALPVPSTDITQVEYHLKFDAKLESHNHILRYT